MSVRHHLCGEHHMYYLHRKFFNRIVCVLVERDKDRGSRKARKKDAKTQTNILNNVHECALSAIELCYACSTVA